MKSKSNQPKQQAANWHLDGQLAGNENVQLFPEIFNELRTEMYNNFPTLWSIVGGMMVHDHENFIEYMNAATDSKVHPLTENLAEGCEVWLKKLKLMKRADASGVMLPSGNF